jgi:hypothetical protein
MTCIRTYSREDPSSRFIPRTSWSAGASLDLGSPAQRAVRHGAAHEQAAHRP